MRGLSASGSSRGLVLLDGVPLNDGFGGWVTWTRVPSDAICAVDVERGAEGDVVGSDALGGVIRIVTPAAGNTTFQIGGEGGTPGVGGLDFAIAGRIGRRGRRSDRGELVHTDGVIPVAPESRGPVDQPANATWSNVYGRVVFGQGSSRLTAVGWGGSDDRGNGTVMQRQPHERRHGRGRLRSDQRADDVCRRACRSARIASIRRSRPSTRRARPRCSRRRRRPTPRRRAAWSRSGAASAAASILASDQLSHAGVDFEDVRPTATTTQALRDDSQAIALQGGAAPAARLSVAGGVRHEWRAAPDERGFVRSGDRRPRERGVRAHARDVSARIGRDAATAGRR